MFYLHCSSLCRVEDCLLAWYLPNTCMYVYSSLIYKALLKDKASVLCFAPWLSHNTNSRMKGLQGCAVAIFAEPPVGRVMHKTASEKVDVLICQAFGFYPKEIQAIWRRGEEDCKYETLHRNVAPNLDGTYYVWLSIEIDPKERDLFSCHIKELANITSDWPHQPHLFSASRVPADWLGLLLLTCTGEQSWKAGYNLPPGVGWEWRLYSILPLPHPPNQTTPTKPHYAHRTSSKFF
uniref:Ig-like domain-containing protein n=1 Tax=Naja naja TaxID=35670 RepID=A0A8C6V916_NAJNA